MAAFGKGNIFLFLLLFTATPSSRASGGPSVETDPHPQLRQDDRPADPPCLRDRQDAQLNKLESLVQNLSDTVARLESSLAEFHQLRTPEKERGGRPFEEHPGRIQTDDYRDGTPDLARDSRGASEGGGESVMLKEVGRRRGITVTKYKPSWLERFNFLSAVKLESETTSINVLPYEDDEGFSKYVAVGDDRGRVFIVLSNGDVLVEFDTLSNSPITSILSYLSIWKNESILITGHRDGAILAHRVWESTGGAGSDDWNSISIAHLRSFSMPEKDADDDNSSVHILEVHLVGRTKYILSSNVNGKVRVFLENGTLFGGATLQSRPLVFLKQRLLFLTESGAGSLDLRSMTVRELECEGLNGSIVRNYVFDASERSKAYGFTSDGDLIQVVLLGDVMSFKCLVRAKRKLDTEGPLSVNSIKGYLLVVSKEKVFVYNVSSPHYSRVSGPRLLFFATIDEIKASFLSSGAYLDVTYPLISSDREKLVVLGLGSGYVGLYRSALPVFKAEFNTVLWSSPVVICILFLIGAWQFLGKKKEVLTSWNPDDPFSARPMDIGASLGPGSGDRAAYADSSRPGDLRDLRGGALRGPTRRYASPPRYPGGAASSFRPTAADPNFRAAPELKFRGQNLEMSGFPKRREPLFQNNQAVDDNASID